MSTKTENFHLTAELMGDFTFQFERNGNLNYYKKATVSVKIGSLIKDITFSTPSDSDISNNFESVFEDVFKIGLEVNLQPIIDKYVELRDIEIRKDKIKKAIAYRKEYKDSWVHRTKEIKIDGLTVSYVSEEEYVEKRLEGGFWNGIKPTLTYKGVSNSIDYQDIASSRYGRNMKYTLEGEVTKWRRRGYKSLDKLAEMFVQLVDFKINSDKAEEIAKENKKLEEESKIKHLEDTFGCKAEVKKEWKYSNYSRNKGYYMTNYYITFNGKTEKISFRKDSNDVYTYTFGSFDKLTASQVNKIIQVLDEG
jgi:hypothetical protein